MMRWPVCCILLGLGTAVLSGQGLEDGLVGWWPLNEGQGAYAADLSPGLAEGVIQNGAWAKGDFGRAVRLSGDDSYIEMPMPAGLDGSDAMALSVWVTWEGTGRYPNIVQGGWNPGGFMIFVRDQTCSFRMGRPGHRAGVAGEQWREISAPLLNAIPLKRWVHLAVSFQRPRITTYVDGQKVGEAQWDEAVGAGPGLRIGRWDGGDCHRGLVQDLRLWRRALSADEVVALSQRAGRDSAEYTLSEAQIERRELLRLQTRCAELAISEDGAVMALRQRAVGDAPERDLLARPAPLLQVRLADGRTLTPRSLRLEPDGLLVAEFPQGLGSLKVRVTAEPEYFRFTAEEVTVKDVAAFTFCQVQPALSTYIGTMLGMASDDDSGVCLRSLSLKVAMTRGNAPLTLKVATESAYGLTGSSAALVAGPRSELLTMLRAVALNEPVPRSEHGGPWALDSSATRGSYLFANLAASATDEWIDMARRGGFEYIHLHGWWQTLGHYGINRGYFPNGIDDMKRSVDKIRDAGMKVTCHTLTACIDPRDPWVTPVPSDHLIAMASYTLAKPFNPEDKVLYVNEKPVPGHEVIWSYSCNGNAIKIGKEIIRYTALSREAPYAFENCERGAFGTTVAAHAAGDRADYLQQRYIAFYPEPDSPLADDLADAIAGVYNTLRLDGIYFDGSEGMRSRYGIDTMRWKIFSRLHGGITEASCWGHNSWWFHSRLGAWDHPVWAMRRNHDAHVAQSLRFRKADLVQPQLGWWAPRGPTAGARGHFVDEMEYFGAKNLSLDGPMSIQGVSPSKRPWNARIGEMFTILGWYERLRLARYFTAADLAPLGEPKKDFRLRLDEQGHWRLTPVHRAEHRLGTVGPAPAAWAVQNPYGEQPFRARLEALYSVPPAGDSPAVLADFSAPDAITATNSAPGVTQAVQVVTADVRGGTANLRIQAENARDTAVGAWTFVGADYPHPYHSMGNAQALGLWVKGDGSGALLNLQIQTPYVYHGAVSDHYVDLDFTGWRYVELLLRERDADRMGDYTWPYSTSAASHPNTRSAINPAALSSVRVYLNAIPAGGKVDVTVGPILALPQIKVDVTDLVLSLNGRRLVLPVRLESGHTLEFEGIEDCVHYDERGELLARFVPACPDGEPRLLPGENRLELSGAAGADGSRRAQVTVMALGEPFGRRADAVDWARLERDYALPRVILAEDGRDNAWTVYRRDEGGASPNDEGSLEFELEVISAGTSQEAYEHPASTLLDDCADPSQYQADGRNDYGKFAYDSENQGTAKPGVTFSVAPAASEKSPDGGLQFTATSVRSDTGGWAAVGRRFEKPVDISTASGIGLWLKGDGSGASFKVQLRDVKGKWHDMVTPVTFDGWQFLEFRLADAKLDLTQIEYILYYYNGLPAARTIDNVATTGQPVSCIVDGVKAMRQTSRLSAPVFTLNGEAVTFPAELFTGCTLSCTDQETWIVRGPGGQEVARGRVEGRFPRPRAGANTARLAFTSKDSDAFRVVVNTVTCY